jgi:hypothetical protein
MGKLPKSLYFIFRAHRARDIPSISVPFAVRFPLDQLHEDAQQLLHIQILFVTCRVAWEIARALF